ncbi:asparagine synthase (glutamine-hydrolyzing) [bacterium CPR1]|nr:asparagine synthase (glutamine-hydrolyzing) [bacterium CPR1]
MNVCGIAGIFGIADESRIQAMVDALAHRGPDDQGTLVDPIARISLGHRRLSIIDLSPLGRQPMSDSTDRYWITYNGEVYNYRELRLELEELGHYFVSGTDTEVVLKSYIQWGAASLSRLRGMFAFGVFDRHEGSLFLARDRFGIKPLLYSKFASDGLVFASELKSILASGLVARQADPQSLWDYLSIGAVPQPATILAGVRCVPAGHWVLVDKAGHHTARSYWDLARESARNYPDLSRLPRQEAHRRIRALLEESTRLHLLSDVPVGGFLSGGIDSTAVVGLMSRQMNRGLETYSVGFESAYSHLDELPWARLAADRLGTTHHEVVVTGADVAANYDDLIGAIDQPSIDGTNAYFVSRAARRTVTVALSGLGGDELFAGYRHFRRFQEVRLTWDRLPLLSMRILSKLMPARVWPSKHLAVVRGSERYARLRCLANEREKFCMVGAGPSWADHLVPLARVYLPLLRPTLDAIAEMSYVEMRGYMLHTLLRDLDAMSMRHSLEVRPVLLDHCLAEFVFALPAHLKLDATLNKPLLVRCLDDVLPKDIVARPKMGFEMPLFEWLAGPLKERALAAIDSPTAAKLFGQQYLARVGATLKSAAPQETKLWAYITLINWLDVNRIEVPV